MDYSRGEESQVDEVSSLHTVWIVERLNMLVLY